MASRTLGAKWTVEKLAAHQNCIDVLKFNRRSLLTDCWISFVPLLGWRGVAKIHASRYSVLVEWCDDRVDRQQIKVSWTRQYLGGFRPWLHCPCGRRVVRLFKGPVMESATRKKGFRSGGSQSRTSEQAFFRVIPKSFPMMKENAPQSGLILRRVCSSSAVLSHPPTSRHSFSYAQSSAFTNTASSNKSLVAIAPSPDKTFTSFSSLTR
jgi:hypothetical protein